MFINRDKLDSRILILIVPSVSDRHSNGHHSNNSHNNHGALWHCFQPESWPDMCVMPSYVTWLWPDTCIVSRVMSRDCVTCYVTWLWPDMCIVSHVMSRDCNQTRALCPAVTQFTSVQGKYVHRVRGGTRGRSNKVDPIVLGEPWSTVIVT